MYFELGKLASMVVLILFYPKRQNRKLKQKHFLNNFIYTFYYLYLSLVILSEFAYHTFIIIFIILNIAHNQVIKLTLLSFCRCFTDVYPTNHFSNQSNLNDLPNQTNHRVCTYIVHDRHSTRDHPLFLVGFVFLNIQFCVGFLYCRLSFRQCFFYLGFSVYFPILFVCMFLLVSYIFHREHIMKTSASSRQLVIFFGFFLRSNLL